MSEIKIIYKNIDDLTPYAKNPRVNDHAVEAVAASINEFGFKNPIIIDKDNEIVAGHTRIKAAKMLGMEEVPTIIANDLTDEQVRAFRIADNKTAELAEWDYDLLMAELDLLDDIDMEQFGFDDLVDMFEPTAEEDEYEIELPEEPTAKLGQIYQLGRHRLMCGDSTKEEDADRLMSGTKAQMVFTDPPWNVNYGDVEDDNPMGYKPRTILNDFMGTNEFKQFMYDAFSNMRSCTVDGGMVYVVMSAQEWGNMMLSLGENGFHWSSTIIWNKDRLVLSRKDYHTKYEPIWYGWKEGAPRLCPLIDRKQADVWDFERPSVNDLHPTMKPIVLIERALVNSSKDNDSVLDLFGGSGSTLIACEQLDRTCYMMELDPRYVDVIIDRWEKLTGETAVLIS